MMPFSAFRTGIAVLGLLTAGQAAVSATLPVSYSWTSPDGIAIVQSAGSGTVTPTPVPGSYDYSHTISSSTAAFTLPGSTSGSYPLGFEFYDDYLFSVTGAIANAVTTTISLGSLLGIDGLQARLFQYDPPPVLPYIGAPPLGTLIEAWSSPLSCGTGCSGEIVVLDSVLLDPGTYVLQIRGRVSGSLSGSYGGALNLAPVPVPGAVWLFGSALAAFGVLRRRSFRLAA